MRIGKSITMTPVYALRLHGLFEAGTGFIDLAFVHHDA